MKHFVSLLLCLALMCSCALGALAVPTDPTGDATEVNTGPAASNAFFIFIVVLLVLCCIYMFFKFRK